MLPYNPDYRRTGDKYLLYLYMDRDLGALYPYHKTFVARFNPIDVPRTFVGDLYL